MTGESRLKEVTVPDIGDFSDVPVIEVLVAPGDEVAAEDPLVTLESDKATMDVPAPFAGVVQAIEVAVGDTVAQGTLLLSMEVGAGGNGAAPSDAPARTASSAEAGAPGAVDTATAAEAAAEPAEAPVPADTASRGVAPEAAEAPVVASGPVEGTEVTSARAGEAPPYASPAVRRLARERGIDLGGVEGSGRMGRITKEDLEAPAAAPAAAVGEDPVERVALSRIKRISGPRLAQNWATIPHVTHNDDADITDLEAFRKEANASQSEVKVTMVALLAKACVTSLQAFPEVNSSLDGDELILKRHWHIGFAADTPQGLVVPVIKDADRRGILEIAGELTRLSGAAREGKLKPAEMRGATFTISSLGGIGGTSFTPIINAPEVAILGVSRSAMKPVWDGAEFRPRLILPLSLSYDHRVIDGALAARFTAHLAGVLGDMRRALL